MKVIIFNNEFGGVSLCVPVGEMGVDDVKNKDTPEHSIIVDVSELPQGHEWSFNAWELHNGSVSVNLDKAKGLAKQRLRAEREPLLAAQDVLFQRAQETGADTTAIVVEKQRLRDVTTLVDSCTTLDQMSALKAAKD